MVDFILTNALLSYHFVLDFFLSPRLVLEYGFGSSAFDLPDLLLVARNLFSRWLL